METQSIVVLDFGAQYSQLIARRIRELKVFSAVLPRNASLEEIRSYSPVGIILSGTVVCLRQGCVTTWPFSI